MPLLIFMLYGVRKWPYVSYDLNYALVEQMGLAGVAFARGREESAFRRGACQEWRDTHVTAILTPFTVLRISSRLSVGASACMDVGPYKLVARRSPTPLRTTHPSGKDCVSPSNIMWPLLLGTLFLTAFLTGFHHRGGKPRVQLGETTLIGKRLRASNLEFFGGFSFLLHDAIPFSSRTS